MTTYKLFTPEDVDKNTANNSPLDYIQINLLGFCGCGTDEVLYFVRDFLKIVKQHWDTVRADEAREYKQEHWDSFRLELNNLIGVNSGAIDFVFHYLNEKDFMEHGSSIPGWLTDRGEDLLHDLTLALEQEELDEQAH